MEAIGALHSDQLTPVPHNVHVRSPYVMINGCWTVSTAIWARVFVCIPGPELASQITYPRMKRCLRVATKCSSCVSVKDGS